MIRRPTPVCSCVNTGDSSALAAPACDDSGHRLPADHLALEGTSSSPRRGAVSARWLPLIAAPGEESRRAPSKTPRASTWPSSPVSRPLGPDARGPSSLTRLRLAHRAAALEAAATRRGTCSAPWRRRACADGVARRGAWSSQWLARDSPLVAPPWSGRSTSRPPPRRRSAVRLHPALRLLDDLAALWQADARSRPD